MIAGRDIRPTIYVYDLPDVRSHDGYVKVGYTDRPDWENRIKEQMHTAGILPRVLLLEPAMRPDGSCFMDHEIHTILKRNGIIQLNEGEDRNEWFRCTVGDVRAAIAEVKTGVRSDERRTQTFRMRPEQYRAVARTESYFLREKDSEGPASPKFLWNCKMRFGKTFAAYQLAKKMGFMRVLVLTFKPAVESAWKDDLLTHTDFAGWQFVSDKDAHYSKQEMDEAFAGCDPDKPIVVFGSFQNLLGTNEAGGIKAKNEFIHSEAWDLVIFDEYHFGAWRENAKKLFDDGSEESELDFDADKYQKEEAGNAYNESFLPITADYYLYMSGTPFRALHSGEFMEDQIFTWTYSDEQNAKEHWEGPDNPYAAMPKMEILTYRMPEDITWVASGGEYNEFDLNVFFSAKGHGESAEFVYKEEVQAWLDMIRGQHLSMKIDGLKLGKARRPLLPYSDPTLQDELLHTLWLLPDISSCEAMYNLLMAPKNTYYHDYTINLCAGPKAGVGLDALRPVRLSMDKDGKGPLGCKTITLTCGKLTTGVTVRPWTAVFMLRNLKSPEAYFQAAFRAQSPWTIKNPDGTETILKNMCYVFDFSLDRALKQISDYACRLSLNETNPEKKVAEFIRFLPVLAYDGSSMSEVNAQDILDITITGTSGTMLAKRWESPLLVNVDNRTLDKLLNDPKALDAVMRIEGFRALKSDIEVIINKSEHVKKVKKESKGKLTPEQRKELTAEEKEYKDKRKQVQEKLVRFCTRVPVFMYLTDYREACLRDVITHIQPGLFKKVTGLDVADFELLCSVGVFNAPLMNDAIFKFKRYEDSSLSYPGVENELTGDVGGWDVSIKRDDYDKLFDHQQMSMDDAEEAPVEREEGKVGMLTVHGPIAEGAEVEHPKFGAGIISMVYNNGKYILVKFARGEKKFPVL